MSNACNQTRRMKRFVVGLITTPQYYGWWSKRVNDNIPGSSQKGVRSMEEVLKWKNKAEEDLDSLKIDYKKLCLSMRTAGLGKLQNSGVKRFERKKIKTDRWERKFQEAQTRNRALEKSLLESRNEKGELKARVAELEKSLHHYR
ncbi:hypothetical protein Gohar_021682, partial [Gossypium harknessii]|nr:hypothetical protein [Gossypium harknessii]